MLSLNPCADLAKSAQLTFNNMQRYYQHYNVDWQIATIVEQIAPLENWDIIYHGETVGSFRLSFDGNVCTLRDIQIQANFQNKGLGALAIEKVIDLAKNNSANKLKLKVFKISPAYRLYQRMSFVVDNEDERFYYMERNI